MASATDAAVRIAACCSVRTWVANSPPADRRPLPGTPHRTTGEALLANSKGDASWASGFASSTQIVARALSAQGSLSGPASRRGVIRAPSA